MSVIYLQWCILFQVKILQASVVTIFVLFSTQSCVHCRCSVLALKKKKKSLSMLHCIYYVWSRGTSSINKSNFHYRSRRQQPLFLRQSSKVLQCLYLHGSRMWMVFDWGRPAASEVSAACYCQLTVLLVEITAECRSWCLVVCHECHLFHYPTREIPKVF